MAGQKKNLRYSDIPEYYIGWIGISNCGQKTSSTEGIAKGSIPTSCKIIGEFCSENNHDFLRFDFARILQEF